MEALECIKTSRSIRRFTDEKIPHEVLEELVDVARFAPSWKNTQIARYIVVEDKDVQEKIANSCVLDFTYNTKTITRATTLMVVAYVTKRSGFERDGSYTTSKGEEWEMFDAGIATQTLCLAAHEKGIGTCIMGIFDEASVAEAIHLPEGQRVGALVAMGYPAETPETPLRKEVGKLISYL